MNTSVLSSTFFLTLLLMIGLFFFIRASFKDRTEQVQLWSDLPEESLFTQLQCYFDQRAYRVAQVDEESQQVTFEGFVRPSWFLAVFLTLLAGCGLVCFALILSYLLPQLTLLFWGLIALAPVGGWVYWQKAGRMEQVLLKIEPSPETNPGHFVTVRGHRDELIELQRAMSFKG
ncbi:cofactor assembly of complex C subunit B [Spirulina subsalsa]|uniref:cofactor assembly of complex C subunit B n=1 Tax=Spirulina subsalsa TaxID=54311 RepID=UPI000475110E|nr:cofactor assembly of complex C subunit B [Spirulina subsalsa]